MALALVAGGCAGSGKGSGPSEAPLEPVSSQPLPWWEEADWEGAEKNSAVGPDLGIEWFKDGRARILFHDPMLTKTEGQDGRWEFLLITQEGASVTLSSHSDEPVEQRVWAGAGEAHSLVEEDETLTLLLREKPWEGELYGVWARAFHGEGTTQNTEAFYLVEGDTITQEESSLPDFSQAAPKFRYLQQETGKDRVFLTLYWDDTFQLTRRLEETGETGEFWGTWQDGNTAITLWPDAQCCGPDAQFRLEKTGGLRVYDGDGPASLPLKKGDAFQKIGDLLDLAPFDSAIVSQVVDGDRPALFLSREEDAQLLDAFREMMLDAAELRNPRWTDIDTSLPNLQFDLNINGEDITMVLCPSIVAGTEDKYLLVEKTSWMGRVTYTYYQTQQGDDYFRMSALFDEAYEKDPQVFTAAMAAQTRALTAAISNLDWSEDFPLDENGIPQEYRYVLREQRATGYASRRNTGKTYGAGSRTSQAKTGVYYCTAGTVAVRANEIPYGTRMYIRTPGGGFIYGYAVANDTGTGLVEGVIDVDLFYDTYEESVLNSVRWVDIYILD